MCLKSRRLTSLGLLTALAFALAWPAANALSGENPTPGIVSHIKVLSDKVDDVSSLEAWKKTFIKDGMSDQEKAIAIWKSVATFQHQDAPPLEYLYHEDAVYDPIKIFNVYGYAMCSNASAHVSALARYIGLQARGWGINCHSVPEIFYDNAWHLFDSSLINYFPKADGKIASVEEIIAGVKDWYQKNPDFASLKGKELNDKLYKFMRETPPGWKSGPKGWSRGPDVLLRSPMMTENGWHPAKTHGWYSTMQEYCGNPAFHYEYLPTPGYEVNIQLRPGEKLTRNWSNKGLHINMDGGNAPGCLTAAKLEDFPHWAQLGNIAPGRVGNGTLEYNVPLASGDFKNTALEFENLATQAEDHAAPALHVKDATKPGVLVIRMRSSYVYLSGQAVPKAAIGAGGEILAEISDNNGLDWKPAGKITASSEPLDLKPLVYRRYDYRLKLTFKGQGSGLDALKISHDIQHSQRPLPALAEGDNKITFSAGPQEGTVTLDGNLRKNNGKQRDYTELHPVINNINEGGQLAAPQGDITFPVATPGDLVRLRMSGGARNWGEGSSWDFQVSFDNGKTFKSIGQIPSTASGCSQYSVCSDIPANTRKALVRYAGTKKNDTCLCAFRIDADYKEAAGGFRPVKITYVWDEGGQEKQDTHVAKQTEDTYSIKCGAKPLMKSIVLELAE